VFEVIASRHGSAAPLEFFGPDPDRSYRPRFLGQFADQLVDLDGEKQIGRTARTAADRVEGSGGEDVFVEVIARAGENFAYLAGRVEPRRVDQLGGRIGSAGGHGATAKQDWIAK